ncbi:related to MAK3 N-acetyltransferase [Sporisorium reilianum f. sp. reilianum]|uniref:Related to MAK3 N-acetyltransferase n=1 Tax=Sporisorium reilianum f. sp. reilianum TaxID=72559 RepID=A0A2N8U9H4_9BASI|nr:related to MAK3 N-acetyltransferase [Sporisorium reilianum f. sp. reilianum]
MHAIISLIEKELSEPYIVYTYRYFVNQWPSLCFLAYTSTREPIGVIVCKLDRHLKGSRLMRGYIAMISVKHEYRGKGLAKRLVRRALEEMVGMGAQEVVLETEADNEAALGLYERLGFIREKRLHRFYLNGKDSFRLVLPIPQAMQRPIPPELDAPPPPGLVQPPSPSQTFNADSNSTASHAPDIHTHIL